MTTENGLELRQVLIDYTYDLTKEVKSPEMVAAISELYDTIMKYG
ncbi:hypothetical protein [Lentilactobacillus senioris]